MISLLIADPDTTTRDHLAELLSAPGVQILVTGDGAEALQIASERDVDVVIAELQLPGVDGLGLIEACRQVRPETAVILLTAFGSVEDAVHAMRAGATDFLSKPFSDEQVVLSFDRSIERLSLVRENQQLRAALDDRARLDKLVAHDAGMQRIFETVRSVAPSRATVLLTGESGTGKTQLARALHALSPRASAPFVEVNCGALPDTLLESELFGHVRGAFTGAVKDRPGKFEAADGGTIFLDEVGTATASCQVKLLRAIQDRQIERLGDSTTIEVDVRVVVATNLDLEQAVREGAFREDLFYRINVVRLAVPPLRERRDDIPLLAEHFLRRSADANDKAFTGFTRDALLALVAAPWPGNVRQLENAIERAVVLGAGPRVDVDDLPPDLDEAGVALAAAAAAATAAAPAISYPGGDEIEPLRDALVGPERAIIEHALRVHGGNRQETARSLGINRSTLFHKMKRLGIDG